MTEYSDSSNERLEVISTVSVLLHRIDFDLKTQSTGEGKSF